jgi:LPXTG-motif cell wall-anchored protein
MKKSFLVLTIVFLLFSGLNFAIAQEQPAPQKDTVNMDTDAKPEFYYAVEDDAAKGSDEGSSSTILIIAGVVVVAGVAGFLLMKKKK